MWDSITVDEPDSENMVIVVGLEGIPTMFAGLIGIIVMQGLSKSWRCSVKIISIIFLHVTVGCSVKSFLGCIDPCRLRGSGRRQLVVRRRELLRYREEDHLK